MQIAYLRKWGVSKCVTCHDFYSVTTYVTDRWSHCAFFNIHYILHQSSHCAIKYPFNVSSGALYKIWTLFIDRWSHCNSLLFITFCIKPVSARLIFHFIMVSIVNGWNQNTHSKCRIQQTSVKLELIFIILVLHKVWGKGSSRN